MKCSFGLFTKPCDWFIKDRAISSSYRPRVIQTCWLGLIYLKVLYSHCQLVRLFFWCLYFVECQLAKMLPLSYKSVTCKEIMNVELVAVGKMLAHKLDKDYPNLSINQHAITYNRIMYNNSET